MPNDPGRRRDAEERPAATAVRTSRRSSAVHANERGRALPSQCRHAAPRSALRRAVLAVAALLAIVAGGLAVVPAPARADDTTVEATWFTAHQPLVPGRHYRRNVHINGVRRVRDPRSTSGHALRVISNRTAATYVEVEELSHALVVRARRNRCGPAPKLVVSADGQRLLSTRVTSDRYTEYAADIAVDEGTHYFEVRNARQPSTPHCHEVVTIDILSFQPVRHAIVPSGSEQVTPISTAPPGTPPLPGAPGSPVPGAPGSPGTTPPSVPAPPLPNVPGNVIFNGDFETGSLSQWTAVQRAYPDRVSVVNGARQGQYTARFEIDGGDPMVSSGQRAELLWGGDNQPTLKPGDDLYFGWSTKFAPDFPSPTNGGHCLFAQFKGTGTGGSPVDMHCRNERIQIGYDGDCGGWNIPFIRGGWNDFVVHIRFSSDPNIGFVEIWSKAPNEPSMTKKLDHCSIDTMKPGRSSYLKLGYYRRNDEQRTGVMWEDGMRVGTSFSAVAPQ